MAELRGVAVPNLHISQTEKRGVGKPRTTEQCSSNSSRVFRQEVVCCEQKSN